MSHFTLASGQRTETHSSYCPVCRERRSYAAPLPWNYARPLGCTRDHQQRYVGKLRQAVQRAGHQPSRMDLDLLGIGILAEHVSVHIQETLL